MISMAYFEVREATPMTNFCQKDQVQGTRPKDITAQLPQPERHQANEW